MNNADPPQFGATLRALLIDAGVVTKMGNPDWMAFSKQLSGITYESLRKAIVGERPASEKIILEVARALGVSPNTFTEYRLMEARRSLDPGVVGWAAAIKSLRRWEPRI